MTQARSRSAGLADVEMGGWRTASDGRRKVVSACIAQDSRLSMHLMSFPALHYCLVVPLSTAARGHACVSLGRISRLPLYCPRGIGWLVANALVSADQHSA